MVRLPLADSADGRAWQGDWVLLADAPNAVPVRLHFDQYRALDALHFELADSAANATLTCARKPAQPDWPPVSCDLRDADAAGDNFTSVALTRMDGLSGNRIPTHLLRVTP